jgi:ATP-binding protein involved in chromosome partitioning
LAEPTEIRKLSGGTGLKITWSDGNVSQSEAYVLRESCLCAACRHELTGEILIPPNSIPKTITLQKIELIGNYALGILFSDGHSTGIYTFEHLRKL